MTLEKPLSDCYKILEPTTEIFGGFSMLDAYAMPGQHVVKSFVPHSFANWEHKARILSYAVSGQVAMKMLKVYADGNEHHYDELCRALDLEYGYDIESFRSLIGKELIAFSSRKRHGRKYYTITGYGKDVLRAVDANQVYFRVARWYKVKGEEFYKNMLKADLSGEESWKDLLPESMTALLDALFNPESQIRKLGSAYRWMNNFMYLLKSNDEFYQKIDCPEVAAWLQQNESKYPAISRFLKIFSRMQKKRAKAA